MIDCYPLYLLQEANDMFGPKMEENLFRLINVIMFMDFGFEKILLKNFLTVLLLESDVNLYQRNNIIKLQSLIHNHGYTNERPEEFKNAVKFSYEEILTCDIENCNNKSVIICIRCKKSLYLKHFFVEYHYCNICNE
ncbi:hypothetical protein P5V15_002632 [Pogonomyrmex californicus]